MVPLMSTSSSDLTCSQVCEKSGHHIKMFNRSEAPTEYFLCIQCGKTLEEITANSQSKLKKFFSEAV